LADRPPSTVRVALARPRPARVRAGVLVCQRALPAQDVTEHRGLRLTARPLTVLEAAVQLGEAGSVLLDRALRGGLSLSAVHEAHRRNRDAPMAASAGKLLAATADRHTAAARRRLLRLARDSGLAGWVPDLPVAGRIVPLAFPAARVAVEVTAWAEPAGADARRRGTFARHGWVGLRYGWAELAARPDVVLADIAAQVGAARAP